MGPLRLVLEVLLFFYCTLCWKFGGFCSLNTLGLTPFGFGSQEATIVFLLWTLGFKIPDSELIRLCGVGYDLFRILIFGVLDSELVIALVLGICIGCIIAKTNIQVCVVG